MIRVRTLGQRLGTPNQTMELTATRRYDLVFHDFHPLTRCPARSRSALVRRAQRNQCAIGYAQFYSRAHAALIHVYDEAGNVLETHEHKGDVREP